MSFIPERFSQVSAPKADFFSRFLSPNGIVPDTEFPHSPLLFFHKPPSLEQRSTIRFILGQGIRFEEATQEQINSLLRHWRAALMPEMDEGDLSTEPGSEEELRDLASEAPVIRMVNHLLERSLDLRASDIHFEPEEEGMNVRVRVDGVMSLLETLPKNILSAVASRLKLMARLDIGEKRLPQDGRIQFSLDKRKVDLRVSTLPGVHGESIVLRILDRGDVHVELESLGMPPSLLENYRHAIQQPHGMILVTGPTGSGKTTTLYGTLEKINTPERKIITVEDPVEYQLSGITQIHVNARIGLTFASGLRSIVRQDPDVIMIGEIRDQETAEIAIESALTGHLVFSTLHTNDAAGAITRLEDMGVEPYLLSSSVLAILAQRLVRRVCPHCREETSPTEEECRVLEITRSELPIISRGRGCERCGESGYRGRIGLYELLTIPDSIRNAINESQDASSIRTIALQEGMRTLRQDGVDKIQQQLTTPEEVLRVTRLE
ncbi:MAG: type II/IV secretion system protein [Gammaproteobacteria bacterium]|nr:type II/IV secretion system protein [Gammaproteobacteria bacterium]